MGIDLGVTEGAVPRSGIRFAFLLVVFEESEASVPSSVSEREDVTDVKGALFWNGGGLWGGCLIARQPIVCGR